MSGPGAHGSTTRTGPGGSDRLRRRIAEVLTARHRPYGDAGAAALSARAASGVTAAEWATRLGIDRRRLDQLEGGWLHPALAPARLARLDTTTSWLDLARRPAAPGGPLPPGTVGDLADPLGASRSRHPAARRRPVSEPTGHVHGADTPPKPPLGTVPVSPGRGTVIPRRTPGRHG